MTAKKTSSKKTASPKRATAAKGSAELQSVQAAVLSLDDKALGKLQDAGTRAALKSARVFLTRYVAVRTASSSDAASQAEAEQLDEAGMTDARAATLAGAATDLYATAADRDEKAITYHAAVSATDASASQLEKLQSSLGSRLRGQFGNTSSSLKAYGISPLGQGAKRKPAPAKKPPQQPPPAS